MLIRRRVGISTRKLLLDLGCSSRLDRGLRICLTIIKVNVLFRVIRCIGRNIRCICSIHMRIICMCCLLLELCSLKALPSRCLMLSPSSNHQLSCIRCRCSDQCISDSLFDSCSINRLILCSMHRCRLNIGLRLMLFYNWKLCLLNMLHRLARNL